ILNKVEGLDYHLTQVPTASAVRDADLCIWDSPAKEDTAFAITDQSLSKHVFLLNRHEAANFQEIHGSVEVAILLKPVTPAYLSAFLRRAAAYETRNPPAHSVRAERDEMLQCLIQANLQLQEYDQDRTNFLTRAVHDFRAPL